MSEAASQSKHQVILFFGVVGAGKGTQVELLETFFKGDGQEVLNVGFGERYRALISSGSRMGNQLKARIDAGNLGPDFLTNAIASDALEHAYSGTEHVIFDGYPRTIAQANALHDMCGFFGWNNPHIIFMELSDEEAVARLEKRGRADDTAQGIKRRLEVYRNEVLPALEHLQNLGQYQFHKINGEQSIEAVHRDILQALGLDS